MHRLFTLCAALHNQKMESDVRFPTLEHLPFFITAPDETDLLLGAVALALVAVVIGFGALYFTIQAIPDRIAEGTSKAQMQLVGLLGLISLFTMNNLYWIAAILLAAVRIPDVVTPLKEIAASLKARGPAHHDGDGAIGVNGAPTVQADTKPVHPSSHEKPRVPAATGDGALASRAGEQPGDDDGRTAE